MIVEPVFVKNQRKDRFLDIDDYEIIDFAGSVIIIGTEGENI